MAHFKCVPCQARLSRLTSPANLVGDLCPNCGALLEQVGELSEVVGFQAIKPPGDADAGGRPDTHERLAERVGDLTARREARLADEGRWLDDADSFCAGSEQERPLPVADYDQLESRAIAEQLSQFELSARSAPFETH